ncbi:enoyl-CoA hydratase/isomerase family protein [Azospirillum sp. RWY-5-1]|uniref:Enoyl-CoA hydratase/isomerase family protein n=1 Tax=Azospirillum oleiclasticum TaxID=2735135 RepID=A0ABX2TEG3_9PROT|nr:enoyl-CoA hydratase/isomerase family protein [Azospirillum oleiclasticum]NYZ14959.1 enoyl-CoA hydratase/isomerase family protein [Azospirillum oleiclasticum]NYZ22721.1 enoyl-CoA hydratase/isomerase family protein [Azospirillum oleiclasticum]
MGITLSVNDGIATVTIDRPEKLNALTLAMYRDLGDAFNAVGRDDAVEVVVLTGAGDRAFCVGADLTESIPALASDRFDISEWDDAHIKAKPLHKPVIAAVNGLCLGGGFEIMLATDIRIASTAASFALPEPGLGFVPAGGTLVRLVRQIGYAHAMEIMLTGDRFDAAHMERVGVVNRVVPPDALMPEALRIATRLRANSGQALRTIKEAALDLRHLDWAQAFAAEARLGQRTFTSADAREGLRAFGEKRKPDFHALRRAGGAGDRS